MAMNLPSIVTANIHLSLGFTVAVRMMLLDHIVLELRDEVLSGDKTSDNGKE